MPPTTLDRPPLTVVVAPDSLKGSCTAAEAAAAIARGVRDALGPHAVIRQLPLADGGEGTLDALVAAWGGTVREVPTTDARGRPRVGRVGEGFPSGRDSGTDQPRRLAVVEAADANGLPHVVDLPPRPLDADTHGVGELVRAALESDPDELLLCLGGSATSDGGAGLLRALGARLLDRHGRPVAPGARGLDDLDRIDLDGLDPRAFRVRWRVACDVVNPLTGPHGAAAVFAPQKGATPEEIGRIDRGLARLAAVLAAQSHRAVGDLLHAPGLGAAGGLALAPAALFDAELVAGSELVADAVGLVAALDNSDLLLTAEGRLDRQSLEGKVISHAVALARGGPSVIVLAGEVALDATQCRAAGIAAALSIARGPSDLAALQADAPALLTDTAAQACGAFAAGFASQRLA